MDVQGPSIERSRKDGIHAQYLQAETTDLAHQFPPRSFECVVALDVSEHFGPENGARLLDAMESIAAKQVIVFTPNGWSTSHPIPEILFRNICPDGLPRRCAQGDSR